MTIKRKRVLLVASAFLGVGVVALLLALWHCRGLSSYPELAWTDPVTEWRVRAVLGEEVFSAVDDRMTAPGFERRYAERIAAVNELRRLGSAAARPLLKVLAQGYAKCDLSRVVRHLGYASEDKDRRPYFRVLAELADRSLNPPLLRMVLDRDLPMDQRIGAIVSLAWSGNREGFDGLCGVVLDRGIENDLRREILFRLPRFELSPPESLRDLLYEPFDEIDGTAACALAWMGGLEAPSLVLDRVGQKTSFSNDTFARETLRTILAGRTGTASSEGLGYDYVFALEADEARAELQEWLDAHPGAFDTEFERAHRAYLDGPRRRRELALRTFEDVADAAEEDLDFAAAALLLGGAKHREDDLERLDRLATLVKRRLAGAEGPEEVIDRLNAVLLKQGRRFRSAQTAEKGSHLNFVLNADDGNCLGYVSLYLAVAERVGLPLHGVSAPFHAFVRWDDGSFRRNIEATDNGIALDDAYYRAGHAGHPIPEACIERGVFLRNMTKREVLGSLLANVACGRLEKDDSAAAAETAERALHFAPDSPIAHWARAEGLFRSRLDDGADVFASIAAGLDLYPLSAPLHSVKVRVLLYVDRLEEALEAVEDGIAAAGNHPELVRLRATTLSRVGRNAEAEAVLREEVSSGQR